MVLYKDTNHTLWEVEHCMSGTCKTNTRQRNHKLKLTCACDLSNITSHIFRHPCSSRRPRVVRDWNHPIYMGLWPGAHFWGQGGGGHIPKGIPSQNSFLLTKKKIAKIFRWDRHCWYKKICKNERCQTSLVVWWKWNWVSSPWETPSLMLN